MCDALSPLAQALFNRDLFFHIVFLETVVMVYGGLAQEQPEEVTPLRSVSTLLGAVALLAALLVVGGAVFGLAVGKESLCRGLMKVAEHGVHIPTLLGGYCS